MRRPCAMPELQRRKLWPRSNSIPIASACRRKEKALFNYALKANGDPHSIVSADIEELRRKGASDCDLIETLETVNTGNSFNLINGALNVGPDDFLSYMKGRGELWKKSA